MPCGPPVGSDYSGGSPSAAAGKTYEVRKRLTLLGRWNYSFVASNSQRPTKAKLYLHTMAEVYPLWVRDLVPQADGDVREGVVYAFQSAPPYSDAGYRCRFAFDDGWEGGGR